MSRLIPWLAFLFWAGMLPARAQDESDRDFRAELILAIEFNDLETTRRVLDEGGAYEINTGNPSPLGTAVLLDNINLVALLLRSGGDPNLTEDSPLLTAIRTDSFDMVRLLFLSGARLPADARELLQLALRGDHAMVLYRELLERGANPDQALRAAVEGRKLEAAQLSLERGASVSSLGELNILDLVPADRAGEIFSRAVRDDNRETALAYFLSVAAADGNRELVDLALDEGATITLDHLEKADQQGQDATVLYLIERSDQELSSFAAQALEEGKTELAEFLKSIRNQRIGSVLVPVLTVAASLFVLLAFTIFLRKNILRSPKRLHQAVAQGDLRRLEKLLDAGSDPNSSHNGRQPLHVAVEKGDLKVTRALLNHGAHAISRASDGAELTALHVAAKNGNISLAEVLLRHGVHADVKSGTGSTPLYVAASAGRGEMVHLLLERGADIHALINQQTLLYTAVSNRELDTARLLLEIGADPNADRGRTSLHVAAALGEPDFVRLLLDYGADLHAVDPEGRTPLALAQFHKRGEVTALLGGDVQTTIGAAAAPPISAPVPPPALDPQSLVTQPIAPIIPRPSPQPPLPKSPGSPVSVFDGSLTIPHPEPAPESPPRSDKNNDDK